jgi:hypothetical protein
MESTEYENPIDKLDTHKKKLIEALVDSLGIVTAACSAAGISRATYYNWFNSDPDFRKAAEDTAEIALDFVENKLLQQIKSGEVSSTIFYLKTKGKKRGYIEKTEMQHDFGNEIGGFEISIKRNRD